MTLVAANWTHRWAMVFLALYAGGVFLIMLKAGSPSDAFWWVAVGPFLVWTVAPVAALAFIIRRQHGTMVTALSIMMMGLAVISGIYIYVTDMFGPGARSTSALIFIFLPIYQWVFPLLALLMIAFRAIGSRYQND